MGTMAKALLLLAALIVCGKAAQLRGDDASLLNFLRGGTSAKLKASAGQVDVEGGNKEVSQEKSVDSDPFAVLRQMEPQMENAYDKPQVVDERGQIIEGRNNATLQHDVAEKRR